MSRLPDGVGWLFFFLAQPQMLNSRSAVEGAVFSLAQALAALIHCYGIGDGDGALETAPPPPNIH